MYQRHNMKRFNPYEEYSTTGFKKRRYASYDIERKRQAAVARRRARAANIYRSMPRTLTQQTISNARTGGFLGIEKKFYDTSLSAAVLTAPIDASGGEHNPSATVTLNTVAQGDGESNRDGRQISMDSIYVKGNVFIDLTANQSVSVQAGIVFIALVLDTQTNGAALNSEDVFKNQAGSSRLAASPLRNLQFTSRFKVLEQVQAVLKDPQSVYDGTNIERDGFDVPFTFYKKLGGLKVTYSGTTAAISNIIDNSLHIIAYTTSTDLTPLLYYQARLRFRG
jgi:hypothetical protein